MVQHLLLALFLQVNSPEYSIMNPIQVMQESKVTVEAASLGRDEEYIFPRYNVPLDADLQSHIWNLSIKHDISYELILAVIKVESNFDELASSGSSLGLMQLNKHNTLSWLKKQVGIKNFDPFNPYHNTEAGVWYLNYLRKSWIDSGYSEEDAFELSLLSYNQGISRTKRWIKQYGLDSEYVRKVKEYKYQLESGEMDE